VDFGFPAPAFSRLFLLICALCLIATPALAQPAAEGRVVVDWSRQLAGEAPAPNLLECARLTRWAGQGSSIELLVVDSSTDPPSPERKNRLAQTQ